MVVDPVLKPRIESVPDVSKKARELFRDSLVWDQLIPWGPAINSEQIDTLLPRFQKVGVDFLSLTVAFGQNMGIDASVRHIARVRREIRERSDWLTLACSVPEIRKARSDGKLAVGFNFQDTWPFEDCIDLVQLYYDVGVRTALLAYNTRNLVADGCAEDADAGLSRWGVKVIKEMNRVGMLVDGSHTGYRSTMDAMHVCEGPFVFSHSNPFAVRPHYRSIRDDQIKACAATGGVIGINGVGFWVGDHDASTEAVFRCLDYTVQLVGSRHVGLGFDYVWDLEKLIKWARAAPLLWPPYQGEEMTLHNYAGAEQMVELTQMMIDHGYDEEAIRGILGENWARVCDAVWK